METLLSRHWHHLPEPEVVELLETDPSAGLDAFSVAHRQERFGPNLITAKEEHGSVVRLLLQFRQPLIYILLAAGTAEVLLGGWLDAAVIFGVVLVNVVIGFIQEEKAHSAIQALAATLVPTATVVRAGERSGIRAAELVPGDLVVVAAGDKIPADLRLLTARELNVDESALTGESVPVENHAPAALDPGTPLAERTNMAYASTLVTQGEGTGIVVATGDHTEIGRISQLLGTVDTLATPLTRKIDHFARILLWAVLALSALTFGVGIARGDSVDDTLGAAVALAVGAIPEGLPAVVTITLAIGVSRLARRSAIVRKLPAVETLGSTTVICSDKTGTLTANQMTVQIIDAGGVTYDLAGVGYEPSGEICKGGQRVDLDTEPALAACLLGGALCNGTDLSRRDGSWDHHGDPTEIALLVATEKAGIDVSQVRSDWRRVDVVPFDSRHRYMATLDRPTGGADAVLHVKGAVEALLPRCTTMADASGMPVPMDAGAVTRRFEALAARGLRVLAIAERRLAPDTPAVDHDDVAELTLVGLQAMIDAPRPEAEQAIAACHSAGITVKMITGDHPLTARAIATGLGIIDGADHEVMTGADLERLRDRDLTTAASSVAVFARVSPEQKLRLVEALQASGDVVAMTGDGVNDAPALRRADIGVAMGDRGTEVAKEAADMVLTDDDFATIEAAVEEGRGIFDNLTKFIIWTLPTNLGEGLVILVAVIVGAKLPILPLQILWINMTTAVLLGLALAFEPKESGIMKRPPRVPDAPIVNRTLGGRVLLVGAILLAGSFGLFELELWLGSSDEAARTVAVAVFVVVEAFYLLNCRSLTRSMFSLGVFSNPWIWLGIATMAVLQLLFTYLPVMNTLFETVPLGAAQRSRVFAVGFAAYLIVGFEKWLRRRGATIGEVV